MTRPEPVATLFDDLVPQSVHCATLVEVGRGELLAACYAFSYETAPDSRIVMSRLRNGVWSPTESAIDYPGVAVGNPVLHVGSDGEMHLFFAVVAGDEWTDARIAHARSSDAGRSWSRARIIHERRGLMPKARPLEHGGRLLLPVYDERTWCSHVLIQESTAGWRLVGDTTARGKTLQPVVVPRPDGRLDMYSRGRTGRIFHALSVNGGYAWTASQPTELPNPNAGIEVVRTRTGALVMVCNPSATGRERISYLWSLDDGASWSQPCDIEVVDAGELSYPYAVLGSDGRVQLLYTRQRTEIVHVALDPATAIEDEVKA